MTKVNLSEEIRKVAAELSAKGETVRPKTIIDILKKRGIEVAPPQGSVVSPQGSVVSKQGSVVSKHAVYEKEVTVTITRAFELGKTVVTQKQWIEVMGTTPWKYEAEYDEDEDYPTSYGIVSANEEAEWAPEGDNYPAVYISWDDATKFCKKLTALERKSGKLSAKQKYRLPTEAEWEYACRAGTTTAYSFGDDESKLGAYAWYVDNSGSELHEVATKKPNPWGLFDMHGNVYEWCEDWYEDSLSGGNDPKGPSAGSSRVLRGGDWTMDASYCRSTDRNFDDRCEPSNHNGCFGGFRIVRVLL